MGTQHFLHAGMDGNENSDDSSKIASEGSKSAGSWAAWRELQAKRALAVANNPKRLLEGIIQGDTREQINNMHKLPWSTICHLEAKFPSGNIMSGTGFLVKPGSLKGKPDPNADPVLLTAAHVLYDSSQLGMALSVKIFGRRTEKTAGSWLFKDRAADWKIHPNYEDKEAAPFDYGIVIPEQSALYGQLGIIEMRNLSDKIIEQVRVESQKHPNPAQIYVAGYPAKPEDYYGRPYRGSGILFANLGKSNRIGHLVDTTRGQSGAPVILYTASGKPRVFAIHTDSITGMNAARRIDDQVLRHINEWSGATGAALTS